MSRYKSATKNSYISYYFGDALDYLFPQKDRVKWKQASSLLDHYSFKFLRYQLPISNLIFAHQTHSNKGFFVSQKNLDYYRSFTQEADYLITKDTNIGIGVLTADCMPLIVYSNESPILAVIHAGWRGLEARIITHCINDLVGHYKTPSASIHAIIGPYAHTCCYEVDTAWAQTITSPFLKSSLIYHNNRIFCDMLTAVTQELEVSGIQISQINTQHSRCTICDTSFFSHRRQKETAGRQMTVASLQRNL